MFIISASNLRYASEISFAFVITEKVFDREKSNINDGNSQLS